MGRYKALDKHKDSILVDRSDTTIVDAAGRRIVEPGVFELRVEPSWRDEVLLGVEFTFE